MTQVEVREGESERDGKLLFHGFEPRECGDHRTVGSYRAWCYDCTEWCYPAAPCRGCEVRALRDALAEAVKVIDSLADQQAMPDDFYVEPLERFRAMVDET